MLAKLFFLAAMMIIVTAFILIPVITESGLAFTCWMAAGMIMGGLAAMLEATDRN